MKKKLPVLVLPIITLILEVLPYGAVLRFGRLTEDGSIGYFRKTYSYFDLLPFGYGNFAPLLVAVATCVILILLAAYCITGKRDLAAAARTMIAVVAVISLGPLVLGIPYYSVIGAMITVSLAAEWLFLRSAVELSEERQSR